jgi:hypothetical protein
VLEIFILIVVLGGLGSRATQRRLDRTLVIGTAAVGWVVILFVSAFALGPAGIILRWLWLGGVFLYVENSHGGVTVGDTWQCLDCRMFNDGGTLTCLCGYANPLVGDRSDDSNSRSKTEPTVKHESLCSVPASRRSLLGLFHALLHGSCSR